MGSRAVAQLRVIEGEDASALEKLALKHVQRALMPLEDQTRAAPAVSLGVGRWQ